jgi:hypothetical protein
VAADLLNDRVIPFFDQHGVPLNRILTDRGTEDCGTPERHEYELYMAVENIDHTRTKVKSPQTNGLVERFHRTVLNPVLPGRVPAQDLLDHRGVAGRPRRFARSRTRRCSLSRYAAAADG